MKFWQKAYFFTLIIVTVTLVGSVAVFVSVTRGNSFASESEKLLERQHTISAQFAQDAAAVIARNPKALSILAQNYADTQLKGKAYMRIKQDENILADTLPVPTTALFEIPKAGLRASAVRQSGEDNYLYVGMRLPDKLQNIEMLFAFDIQPFYKQWNDTQGLFILLGTALFLMLSIVLFFIMRSLSAPLEALAKTAQQWAGGKYNVKSNMNRNDEIGQLSRVLDDMSGRVETDIKAMKMLAQQKQQLVDNLAHELHTPLTAVQGYAEYLQRSRISDDDKIAATNYIISETARLISLSERLLQMAAIRDEKANKEPLKPEKLFEHTLCAVSTNSKNKGVIIKTDIEKNLIIYGEASLLESLFINLTDNAIKACDNKGVVVLSATQNAEGVSVTISDNGSGMEKDVLERLGDEFYRPDKARSRENGGAGLGIALCRAIVKAHDAKMTFQSEINKGTVVTIKFTALQQA